MGAVLDNIASTHKAFVVDFAAVPFLDSTAANAMNRVAIRAKNRDIRLFITGASQPVKRALLTHGARTTGAKFRETIARAVAERSSTISSPISASGIMARTRSQPAHPSRVSKPRIWPRRPDRMALIFAVASVGQTISTTWIGSSSTGWHCGRPSLMPIRAAVRNA